MIAAGLVLCLSSTVARAQTAAPPKPTLFLLGDSTVRNGTANQQGWDDTNPAGAEINAGTVVEGLKRLEGDPLRPHFAAKAGAVPAASRP